MVDNEEQIICDRCKALVNEWETVYTDDGDVWEVCLDCKSVIEELME